MNGLYGNPTLYIAKTKSKLKRENIYFQNNNKKFRTMFSKFSHRGLGLTPLERNVTYLIPFFFIFVFDRLIVNDKVGTITVYE